MKKISVSLFGFLISCVAFAAINSLLSPITEYKYPDFDDCSQQASDMEDYFKALYLFNAELVTNAAELELWSTKWKKNLSLKINTPHTSVTSDQAEFQQMIVELGLMQTSINNNSGNLEAHMIDDLLECASESSELLDYDVVEGIVGSLSSSHKQLKRATEDVQEFLGQTVTSWETYKACVSSACPFVESSVVQNLKDKSTALKTIVACQKYSNYKLQNSFCEGKEELSGIAKPSWCKPKEDSEKDINKLRDECFILKLEGGEIDLWHL